MGEKRKKGKKDKKEKKRAAAASSTFSFGAPVRVSCCGSFDCTLIKIYNHVPLPSTHAACGASPSVPFELTVLLCIAMDTHTHRYSDRPTPTHTQNTAHHIT